MLKLILGVIVGFVAWSIIWVGSDQVLVMASPGWYGAHQDAMNLAMVNGTSVSTSASLALVGLVRSFITSIMSGFLAAFVAGENKRSVLVLGVILLIVGIAVEFMMWNVLPVWYHIIFLIMLIPMTILGGKLKQSA